VDTSLNLALYDLMTGANLEQQQFPEGIAYPRFSNDGRRLFVLTRRQAVYVLDLSEAVKAGSAPPLNLPEADLNSPAPVASQRRQLGKRLHVEVGGA
jgi:hypothetical protein